ncbi:MAG: efflux RND transporter periplasmic adaptor subunit [Cyclobacteriaceae bacterium]|nr:efflux RND transporter periplasmic adaptor subunit [Cyclobacteriaceae bacterium]
MKTRTLLSVLSALMIATVLAACSAGSKDPQTQLEELKKQRAAIDSQIRTLEAEVSHANPAATTTKSKEVAVQELTPRPFDYYVQTQGSVEAVDNILVSAKTMGVLSAVYAQEGQVVRKGQVLAQIDNSVIVSSINELKSSIELANTVYQRQKNLWEQKIGTEVQYLQAKNNKESLEKRLATLNEQLEMSKIKSPIEGSVDAVDVKIGQNVAPGAPAFRVVSFDKLKIIANISESYVVDIKVGNKALVTFPDIDRQIEAKVTFVGKTINQLSRTFPVEVQLPGYTDLRPNMTSILRIIFTTVPNALTVPVNVVQDINKEKVVYIAAADGDKMVARRKVVEVAGIYGNYAQVIGLNAGDKVITVGYQGLNDGEVVKF